MKHSLLNKNNASIDYGFLLGVNHLNDKEDVLIIESKNKYIIARERFHKSQVFLKTLIGCGSP